MMRDTNKQTIYAHMPKKHTILTWLLLAGFLLGNFTPTPAAVAAPWQDKVDGGVLETAALGETEFLVFLSAQADLSPAASLPTKLEKGEFVYRTLLDHARRSQAPLIEALKAMGAAYRPYYIANMVWVRGGPEVVQAVAQRADVARLYANPSVHLQPPLISSAEQSPRVIEAIEWNILKVNADEVWTAGFTGQGVVIGGQDTGYDWDHPALINQYRGWNGTSADHNYNWHDAIHATGSVCGADAPAPCDDNDHGTHTMGTMVGDDGLGNQIGMAPGARWIGCRNMNNGVGTPATYAECYEWFIAPYPVGGTVVQGDPSKAPDVINNSWSCPPSEGCSALSLLTVVNNVRAAGILTVHAAGNSGSACSSVRDPAAIYAASFSVGATDSNDNIASFSSRGPVSVDGSYRLKPEISAPGVNIRSSVPGGGYGSGWNGTSMAAPHVAGLAALLLSVEPGLRGQVDSLENVIEQSAVPRTTTTQNCGGVPGTSIPNNTYGWGRIDALAAMNSMVHGLAIQKSAASAVLPGQVITYTLSITNTHPGLATTNIVLTDTLPVGVSLLNATPPYTLNGSTLRWEFSSLGANETRSVQLALQTAPDASTAVVNNQYGVRSDNVATTSGPAVVTSMLIYGIYMPAVMK